MYVCTCIHTHTCRIMTHVMHYKNAHKQNMDTMYIYVNMHIYLYIYVYTHTRAGP